MSAEEVSIVDAGGFFEPPSREDLIIGLLDGMTDDERDAMFSAIREHFCVSCGTRKHGACFCENDE